MTLHTVEQTSKHTSEDRWHSIRRGIIGVLVSLLLTIGLLDALLYWVDPLGIVAYIHSFERMWETTRPDEATGFTFVSGTHDMMGYSYTILDDESRRVPASNPEADCTIAMIGDSVTFGQGVDDTETWVNRLAEMVTNVAFVNYGRPTFSAPNVLDSYQTYPADGYIWLVINNDDFPRSDYLERSVAYEPASRLYWVHMIAPRIFPRETLLPNGVPIDEERRAANAAEAMGDDVLIFGFDQYPANTIDDTIIIPSYTSTVSAVDAHPSPEAHQIIADDMRPHVETFIDRICSAS